MEEQKATKRLKSEGFVLDAEVLASAASSGGNKVCGDATVCGDLTVYGTVEADHVRTRGGDYTEQFAKANPDETLEPGALVGIMVDI